MSAVVYGTGSVVVGLVGVYPKDGLFVEGYDDSGNLVVHPLSGGFPYKLNSRQAARLREVKGANAAGGVFRKALFMLEGSEATFEGWTDGQLMHGWVMPHFELKEAMRVAAAFKGRFDPALNVFRNRRGAVLETWKAREIKTVDGKRLKVFALGAGLWRWHRAEMGVAFRH